VDIDPIGGITFWRCFATRQIVPKNLPIARYRNIYHISSSALPYDTGYLITCGTQNPEVLNPAPRRTHPNSFTMSSKQFDILDCKVKVRKYVLISQPSRWNKKGVRVVVQSPMRKISKKVLLVPVKRYNGEENNSVCLIPKQDIEKDTSDVYDKAQVTKAISWVDAHGVALSDSSVYEQIAYRRGDQFWICIGASTNDYDEVVTVINLRTFEKGDISIDQVCWYPKIQGPNQELWTLGAETRHLKKCGSKKYAYWSWVICQQLDGSSSTIKTVEIPTKEVKMEDRRLLSIAESRSMFAQRYRCMTGGPADQNESRSCSPPIYASHNQDYILPTPPASPDQQLAESQQAPKTATIQVQEQASPRVQAWRRIFKLSGPMNGQYVLRNSLIHPQEIPQSNVALRQPRLLPARSFSEEEVKDMSDDASTCYSSRESSPSRTDAKDEDVFSHDLPASEGSGLYGAALLIEICRKEKENLQTLSKDKGDLGISANFFNFCNGSKSIRGEYDRNMNKPTDNPLLISRCNLKDPQCVYTYLSTQLHYHSPRAKCALSKPTSSDCTVPHQDILNGHDPNHEHCVSRLGPYPGSAGDCHLANSIRHFTTHICCYWTGVDLDSVPRRSKRRYDDRKLLEAKKKRMRIHDRRAWIGNQWNPGEKVTIRDCDLGEGGRAFMDDLRRGVLDREVSELPTVIDLNVGLMGELSDYLGMGDGLWG